MAQKPKDAKQKCTQGGKKPDWLFKHVPPQSDKIRLARTWNNNQYWWCDESTGGKCDGKWRIHKPADCKGVMKTEKETPKKRKSKEDFPRNKRKAQALRLNKAQEAIFKEPASDEESSDDSQG